MLSPIRTHSRVQGAQHQAINIRFQAFKNTLLCVRNVVVLCRTGLAVLLWKADIQRLGILRLLSG